jgi:arabinofuranan 3-O-arabinosyltransferase
VGSMLTPAGLTRGSTTARPSRASPLRLRARNVRDLARQHQRVVAYLLPTAIALAAVQTWFHPGTVIAAGDLSPPVAPGTEYISHWNHVVSGAGEPTYLVSQLPYYMMLNAAQSIGISAEVAQRIWISILFAGSAAAGVFLTLSVTPSPLAGGVAGLLLAFNSYRLVTTSDPVTLAAFGLAGFLGGILLRAAIAGKSGGRRVAAFALLSTGLSYVSANPPHVLLLLVWLVACTAIAWAAGGFRAFRAAWGFLAKAAPFVVLVNLWWLIPATLTIVSGTFGEQFTPTAPGAWAWTQQRASLLNGISLNTAWGWKEAAYYPYAARLDRVPFIQLRFFLPALALVALAAARGRARLVAASFGVVALVGVVIAKGYHPPLSQLNAWLYEHVPDYWLFRDPMKALLLTTLAFSVLGGIAVDRLIRFRPSLRPAGIVLALALMGGALAYVYPLYTGAVIPDHRPTLPSAHVRIPEAWKEAALFMNAQPRGRVLVLPAANYYQLGTTWGYYGASFTALAIHDPVIELAPGGYFRPPGSVSELVAATQQSILAGDVRMAVRCLQALGIRYVLLRRDLVPIGASESVAPAPALMGGLSGVPGLRLLRSFGSLQVYGLDGGGRSDVYAAAPVRFAGPSGDVAPALDFTESREALVSDPAGVNGSLLPGEIASPGGKVRVFRSEPSPLWKAWIATQPGRVTLHLTDPVRVSINGAPISHLQPIEIGLAADSPSILAIGRNRYFVNPITRHVVRLGLLRVSPGEEFRVWERQNPSYIRMATAGRVGDCDRHDRRTPEQAGLSRSVLSVDGFPTLQLSARDQTACTNFPLKPFKRAAIYQVGFDYRGIDGAAPRACLWEDGPERCAPLPALDPSPGWHRLDATVVPDPKTTNLRLYFYADGTGNGTTITEYRKIVIARFALVEHRPLPARAARPLGEFDLPKGPLPLEVRSPLRQPDPIRVATAGPVSDCNRDDRRTPQQVGLSRSVLPVDGVPTLQLSARDHAACTSFPLKPFETSAVYRVRFDYRGVDGGAPRACLWEMGPERCAPLPALDPSSGWHQLDASVVPESRTTGLRMFFYADGTGNGTTITEYRKVRASAVAPVDPLILGAASHANLPNISLVRVGPAELRAQVSGATGPFLMVLDESYAPGWRIEIPGRDTSAIQHVLVDGYANGWLIPWKGTYEVRLYYGPEAIARAARRADLILVPALSVWLVLVGRRRRGKHARRRFRTRRPKPFVERDAEVTRIPG